MKNQNYTYREIITQVESWENVYSDVVGKKFDLDLSIFSDDYDEIIFFGCGSSYNLSQSASFFTKLLSNERSCLALPSSELLVNTDTYICKNRKYLIIGFSRSGETTESINVVRQLKERNNITSLTFSCKKGSAIKDFSDNHFICRGAAEKSIVMTVSFSSMLFAYCLMLAKYFGDKEMLNEFKYLIDYLNENISNLFNAIKSCLDKNNFGSYFALGSGFNYGLAVEADLKMKEMSQIPSYSYHLYEFNHGPKSLLDKDSLCLILTLSKNLFKNEEIIKEILNLGSKVIVIGYNSISGVDNKNIDYLLYNSEFKFDFIKSFINIPVFQMLAYIKTIKKNLNPDKPNNLDYTMKI
ncbi:MAG: SIS domain-containing protein [Actinobacteria bacterium]|nr:SIS domain-containing protein [Actinomycetota bacterium]MCL5771591.1 SIS domain-containing protein [Actinomycetota bacterium]